MPAPLGRCYRFPLEGITTVITPIFATLTYAQSKSISHYWHRILSDTSHYIQGIRGKGLQVNYLRAFEQHKSGFPHVHFLLLLTSSDTHLSKRNRRYIADGTHRLLKSNWTKGHSDFQPPKSSNNRLIQYVLKEVSKSTSSTHLNKLLLTPAQLSQTPPVPDPDTYPKLHLPYAGYYNMPITKNRKQNLLECTYTFGFKRIKLLTWDRGFVKTYKALQQR